jgi:hypothetical protein
MMSSMKRKVVAVALPVALVASGFALDRLITSTPATAVSAPKTSALVTPTASPAEASVNNANSPIIAERGEQDFYLSDYKQGYSEGFRQALSGEEGSLVNSSREGYNEGFKAGYAAGFDERAEQPNARVAGAAAAGSPVVAQSVVYRQPRRAYASSAAYDYREPRRSRMGPKTKAALRIAAPAAIGAGIGAISSGKKGAGVGALIGGGAGALYHLWKERK